LENCNEITKKNFLYNSFLGKKYFNKKRANNLLKEIKTSIIELSKKVNEIKPFIEKKESEIIKVKLEIIQAFDKKSENDYKISITKNLISKPEKQGKILNLYEEVKSNTSNDEQKKTYLDELENNKENFIIKLEELKKLQKNLEETILKDKIYLIKRNEYILLKKEINSLLNYQDLLCSCCENNKIDLNGCSYEKNIEAEKDKIRFGINDKYMFKSAIRNMFQKQKQTLQNNKQKAGRNKTQKYNKRNIKRRGKKTRRY
jgi:hypothetical protein